MKNIQLTPFERLTLVNQFKLMKENDEDASFDREIRILEEGYTSHYHEVFRGIDEELPVETQDKMLDIVEMYHALGTSQDGNDETVNLEYDANQDGLEFRYAKFLQERYSDHTKPRKYMNVNIASSSGPKLEAHLRMVKAWRELPTHADCRPPMMLTNEQKEAIRDAIRVKR